MSGLLIGAAVAAAVAALAWRRWQQYRAERALPGATPANALPAPRFDEIDATVRSQRCRCGGTLRTVGEGSRSEGDRRLRVVQAECRDCGRERRLFFDVSAAFH